MSVHVCMCTVGVVGLWSQCSFSCTWTGNIGTLCTTTCACVCLFREKRFACELSKDVPGCLHHHVYVSAAEYIYLWVCQICLAHCLCSFQLVYFCINLGYMLELLCDGLAVLHWVVSFHSQICNFFSVSFSWESWNKLLIFVCLLIS